MSNGRIVFDDGVTVDEKVSYLKPLPVRLVEGTQDAEPNAGTITATDSVTTANGVSILAANAARFGFTVVNTDANDLYVGLANANISATNYTFKVPAGQDVTVEGYTGVVKGIWAANGSGQAVVTEYT